MTNRHLWAPVVALALLAPLAGCEDADPGTGPHGSAAAPAPAGQLTATPGIVRAGICRLDAGNIYPLHP